MDQDPQTRLDTFYQAFLTFSASFRPDELSGAGLAGALAKLAQTEKAMALMGSMVGAQMAKEAEGRFGRPRPVRQRAVVRTCAQLWGLRSDQAMQALSTAQRLTSQPDLFSAALGGMLSRQQANVVSEAVGKGPTAIAYLLRTAQERPFNRLSTECRRLSSRPEHPGADSPVRPAVGMSAAHMGGALRWWVDGTGRWHLKATGSAADGETIAAAIRPLAQRAAQEAASRGAQGRAQAHAFDGLLALARGRTGPPGHLAPHGLDTDSDGPGTRSGPGTVPGAGRREPGEVQGTFISPVAPGQRSTGGAVIDAGASRPATWRRRLAPEREEPP